jgi:hypothetical protein
METRSQRRRRLWPRVVVAAFVGILAALVVPAIGLAEPTQCAGTVVGDSIDDPATIDGNVVVPAGADCLLIGVVVEGTITVGEGASLGFSTLCDPVNVTSCFGGAVGGNIKANGATTIGLSYVNVDGNVRVRDSGTISLFRSGIAKNASFEGNDYVSFYTVGIGGNLSCTNNDVVDLIAFISVGGNSSGQCAALPE